MNKPEQALRFVATAAGAALVATFGAIGTAHAADAGNGKALVESHNCAACHGAKFTNPVSGDYPKLAGQHADYIYFALRSYQVGTANPNFGRNNAIMQAQVQSLSLSDMKDIGAYLESLPGELVEKK